jgi:hypothetical protein
LVLDAVLKANCPRVLLHNVEVHLSQAVPVDVDDAEEYLGLWLKQWDQV